MKAIILGAGQGRRLLPLTADTPKALLEAGGQPLVAWQIASLVASGVREVVFVAGFGTPLVEAALHGLAPNFPNCRLRILFNPFFRVADNLVSCWLARGEMVDDFLLINGDTLFEPAVCTKLLSSPPAPVTVVIDRKPVYDADDMKVRLHGSRLIDIGKTLPSEHVHSESIGMILFRPEGARAFAQALDERIRDEAALRRWYLSVSASLSRSIEVRTCLISGHDWCEVDDPSDLARAEAMVGAWQSAPGSARRSLAVLLD
jgi:choline kinase